ncbi:Maf family protein [Maridesulfovibrio sp.]|uniref:Maf family protein n=1 Tax=Maridesulfovibrio sp. TaxID=2795000 RepID=UPI002A18973B|nr:Maf family protein [Maridesulfovibrio sp.]
MKIYTTTKPLILGSASPRRKDLLGSAGIEFKIQPACGEEPKPLPGQNPEEYAKKTALLKALEVSEAHPGNYVLGADTIVVRDMDILGKPADQDEAFGMLKSLCGRSHKVITGCALIGPDGNSVNFSVSTDVEFIDFEEKCIRAYVTTGEPDDKAGAYAIQGLGAFLVKGICGSYTNVVGLPLARVIETLVQWGVVVPGDE